MGQGFLLWVAIRGCIGTSKFVQTRPLENLVKSERYKYSCVRYSIVDQSLGEKGGKLTTAMLVVALVFAAAAD